MRKIIHLSDLHVGHEDCGDKFRALIDNITFLKQPADNYTIVITGDIVDNGTKSEQTDEAVAGIRQLEERGYGVLVVPGNHDYGTGTRGYANAALTSFKERYFGSKRISYPKVDIIGKIAFIGLDLNADELHWRDRFLSEGEIGVAQLRRLKRILNRTEVISRKKVVYLHHHPFDFKLGMQLKDSSDLKEVIEIRSICSCSVIIMSILSLPARYITVSGVSHGATMPDHRHIKMVIPVIKGSSICPMPIPGWTTTAILSEAIESLKSRKSVKSG